MRRKVYQGEELQDQYGERHIGLFQVQTGWDAGCGEHGAADPDSAGWAGGGGRGRGKGTGRCDREGTGCIKEAGFPLPGWDREIRHQL